MTMDKAKRERLEAHGWKAVTVDEFLGLTPEESAQEVVMKAANEVTYDDYRRATAERDTLRAQRDELLAACEAMVAQFCTAGRGPADAAAIRIASAAIRKTKEA